MICFIPPPISSSWLLEQSSNPLVPRALQKRMSSYPNYFSWCFFTYSAWPQKKHSKYKTTFLQPIHSRCPPVNESMKWLSGCASVMHAPPATFHRAPWQRWGVDLSKQWLLQVYILHIYPCLLQWNNRVARMVLPPFTSFFFFCWNLANPFPLKVSVSASSFRKFCLACLLGFSAIR